jgi:excinuclease ABC subunit A
LVISHKFFFSFLFMSVPHPFQEITIHRARVNNLKNLSVSIPRNRLVVITGLSGSGKSSLAFDTLYAEGQRRYVESLSAYARQFLGRMNKPDVDLITGLSPAIAIEQKVNSRNPRSTVGTSTEVYEYLKLLFARIGQTISPISGRKVVRHQVKDVVQYILSIEKEATVMILAPMRSIEGRSHKAQLNLLMQQGFSRVIIDNEILRIEDLIDQDSNKLESVYVVVDRIIVKDADETLAARIADSVETAFYEGNGSCKLQIEAEGKKEIIDFSNRFEADGISFEEPSVNMFTFNNPYGACRSCEGFGSIIGIDEDLVVPNKALSVYEGAIACWKGEKMGEWKDQLVINAHKFDFPIHKPYYALSRDQQKMLWTGNKHFEGIEAFFRYVEEQTYKIQYRVMLSRYRGKTVCPDCEGTRLRKDASYVKIADKSIADIVTMPLIDALDFFVNINLDEQDMKIASRLLLEIVNRLRFLNDVGLGYLSLNRLSNSLSGGESQRINLATSLGSSLVGSTYILDEPSIGLHSRDTQRLIRVLKHLRDIGNTVIVVEHDEDIIKSADQVIDIGPLAGNHGGTLVFQGTFDEIINDNQSLTGAYLSGKKFIPVPGRRRKWNDHIILVGASENNLKNLDVKFPLGVLTVVTGVSGSGKSSLVRGILYPAIRKILGGYANRTGRYGKIDGDLHRIEAIEMIDQNPIGRSSRSNPVTYVKAFDEIRQLFADQKLSKARNYKAGYFSFNVPGGRCDQCEGDGVIKIEMQFMADIYLTCDSCHGKRFKQEVLDIKYEDKSVTDILDMTVDEAIDFFRIPGRAGLAQRILQKIKPLQDVGLGYLRLGQSSNTLSGGEAQRIKLASFLTKGSSEKRTLFIFDEPTTGLHFHDINRLLDAFNALIENGHTLIVIEHNPEVIKSADWVIDLGPEGGSAGGFIVFEGIPEDLAKCSTSYTAKSLAGKV